MELYFFLPKKDPQRKKKNFKGRENYNEELEHRVVGVGTPHHPPRVGEMEGRLRAMGYWFRKLVGLQLGNSPYALPDSSLQQMNK